MSSRIFSWISGVSIRRLLPAPLPDFASAAGFSAFAAVSAAALPEVFAAVLFLPVGVA